MTSRSSYKSSWLPEMGNRADAVQAMKGGAIASWIVAAINIAIGAYILLAAPGAGSAIGLTGAAMIDGTIFGVIGIFIWRQSFVAAWLGLGFFTLEKVYQWTTQPKALMGIIVAALLWIAFLNGVRGATALRRFNHERAKAAANNEAA